MTHEFSSWNSWLKLLRDNSRVSYEQTCKWHAICPKRTHECKENLSIKSGKVEGVSMHQGLNSSIMLMPCQSTLNFCVSTHLVLVLGWRSVVSRYNNIITHIWGEKTDIQNVSNQWKEMSLSFPIMGSYLAWKSYDGSKFQVGSNAIMGCSGRNNLSPMHFM